MSLGEGHAAGRILGIVPVVGIDILPQQIDFLVAGGDQPGRLADDALRIAAPLGAPDERHDAIGAHVVAAAHNGDEGAHAFAVHPHRGDVGIGFLVREQGVDLLAVHGDGRNQPRDIAVGVGAGHEIDGRVVEQFLLHPLGHAAQHADHHAAAPLLLLTEHVEAAQHALLGIVAHRTGIDQDQVGLVERPARPVAGFLQDRKNDLAVVHVHLAAVGLDIHIHLG